MGDPACAESDEEDGGAAGSENGGEDFEADGASEEPAAAEEPGSLAGVSAGVLADADGLELPESEPEFSGGLAAA